MTDMTHAQQLRDIADRVYTGEIGTLNDAKALRAIAAELEALKASEPMNSEQIDDAISALGERDAQQACKLSFELGVRAAEAHHNTTSLKQVSP